MRHYFNHNQNDNWHRSGCFYTEGGTRLEWSIFSRLFGFEVGLCSGDNHRNLSIAVMLGLVCFWLRIPNVFSKEWRHKRQFGSVLYGQIFDAIGQIKHDAYSSGEDIYAYQKGAMIPLVVESLSQQFERPQPAIRDILKQMVTRGFLRQYGEDRISDELDHALYDWPRCFGLRFHNGGIWWQIWDREDMHSSTDPKWQNGAFFPLDFLLGARTHSDNQASQPIHRIVIPMPERGYPATVQIYQSTWKRKRWPFAETITRARVDIPGGIAVPGKGENSWDCGGDAIFGQTSSARTIDEAIQNIRESALGTRQEYGGRNWEPNSEAA